MTPPSSSIGSHEEAADAMLLDALGKLHAAERLLTTALPSTEGVKRADVSDALDFTHKALGLVSECTAGDLHEALALPGGRLHAEITEFFSRWDMDEPAADATELIEFLSSLAASEGEQP